jgi:hypothetical protein
MASTKTCIIAFSKLAAINSYDCGEKDHNHSEAQ